MIFTTTETYSFDIDVDYIIEYYLLTKSSPITYIDEAIADYLCGCDDDIYYHGGEIHNKIVEEIMAKLPDDFTFTSDTVKMLFNRIDNSHDVSERKMCYNMLKNVIFNHLNITETE